MLRLTIKLGDGFSIGPEIVVKLKSCKATEANVVIQAPRNLLIKRIEGSVADSITGELSAHIPKNVVRVPKEPLDEMEETLRLVRAAAE